MRHACPDLPSPENTLQPPPRDKAFCRYMTVEFGVTAIPPSSFYSEEHRHLAANYARFACCKVRCQPHNHSLSLLPAAKRKRCATPTQRDEELEEARKRLVSMKDVQAELQAAASK